MQRGPIESDPLRSGESPSHGRADDSHLAWGQAELSCLPAAQMTKVREWKMDEEEIPQKREETI